MSESVAWSDHEYDEALDGLGPVAIRALLSLGIADRLATGSRPVDALASEIGASVDALGALMSYLSVRGIVTSTPVGYALNDRSLQLLAAHPSGIAPWLQDGGPGRLMLDSFTAVTDSVRTGRSTFELLYDASFFDVAEAGSDGAGFTSLRGHHGKRIASALIGIELLSDGEHIVDVGGGNGEFLMELLSHYPHSRGTLFDRPAPVRDSLARARDLCLTERFTAVGGDFFKGVPASEDSVLLSNVLHNWPDADAKRITEAVAQAVPTEGRVLVIESCMDSVPARVATSMNLRMALLCGGRERTGAEYDQLFSPSGFQRRTLHSLTSELDVLEYRRH